MWLLHIPLLVIAALFAGNGQSLLSNDLLPDTQSTFISMVTDLDTFLTHELITSPHQVVRWTGDQINFACKDRFVFEGYDAEDIEMFQIVYEDCHLPWVMCRHNNASHTAESIADAIGYIPVTMRQYVRHVVALPGVHAEGEEMAYNDYDTLVLKGGVGVRRIIAEAAISLGRYASMTGTAYWNNDAFVQAHANDTAILSAVPQTSPQAHFAELAVLALADYQRPGIWKSVVPKMEKIHHQLEQIQRDLGKHFEVMVGGAVKQCPRRLLQDSVVGRADVLPMSPEKLRRPWVNVR